LKIFLCYCLILWV